MGVTHEFESETETAVMMPGGGYHVRPTAEWVTPESRSGRKVYQRRIIVLVDWQEVSPCDDRSSAIDQP